MKETGIIVQGWGVRAILDGRKTQTRRIMKSQPIGLRNSHSQNIEPGDRYVNLGQVFYAYESTGRNKAASGELTYRICKCPYGKVGDRLWVREKHAFGGNGVFFSDSCDGTVRVAWTSGRFMKKIYARLWLEITGIRVERVQEISLVDCDAEGMSKTKHIDEWNARHHFANLWDSLYGKGAWKKNEWVWVIEFKRVQEMPNGK